MYDVVFEKAEGHCEEVNRRSVYAEAAVLPGSEYASVSSPKV